MKANPGGEIDPDSAVGRNDFVDLLWETVEVRGVVMTAERRIGKTTVMKMMRHAPRAGWVLVYQDLEACHTAMDFAREVSQEVEKFLGKMKRVAKRSKDFWDAFQVGAAVGGVTIGKRDSVAPPWKVALTRAIEDLVEEGRGAEKRLLFLWDELPYMLSSIQTHEGATTAMELLDVLRALRQKHPELRMIITGSIGLHHVLTALKDDQYGNAPLNDMAKIDVPTLNEEDAAVLADRLIAGEKLASPEPAAAALAIAQEADCFAFYVHHIVFGLKQGKLEATRANARKVVQAHFVDPNDPWQLRHYRDRIRIYYGKSGKDNADTQAVRAILDHLAVATRAVAVDELLAMLKGSSTFDDKERLRALLELMESDHYVRRETNGKYRFRFPLVGRWWKVNRDL